MTSRRASRSRRVTALILLSGCLCPHWSVAAALADGHAQPSLWPRAHSVGLSDARTEARIDGLLARMSLSEKVGQVIQADIGSIKPADLERYPLGAILAGGDSPPPGGDLHSPASLWLETARAFKAVAMQLRPGHVPIPLLFGIDAVHGNAHIEGATVFPHDIGLGAAHDPDLIRRIGEVTAQETLAVGMNWVFAPAVAVPQDLRWGRSYEGYSEDPLQVGRDAEALVRGLQGDAGEPRELHGARWARGARVAATAKHFIGDGATAGGIDEGDAQLDEQQLIRTQAQGYVSTIDAGVMTVMASYSSWQGRKMHGNRTLLTEVLKGRLGFQGFVVGDWNGHGQLPGCSNDSCPAALNAGIDMLMVSSDWRALFDHTLSQVRAGEIPAARLEDAVRRILRVKLALGGFDGPQPLEGRLDLLGAPPHRALARSAVRGSLVLLKNRDQVLPIRGTAHVLLTGEAADDIGAQCGGWTLSWQGGSHHNADFPQAQSIYTGMLAAMQAAGGSVELSSDGRYTGRPDVAVVVYGEQPYAEMHGDRASLAAPEDASILPLLQQLRAAKIPVVSVFLSGRPLSVDAEIDASDAFVAAWLPGSEGGGIADVLVGDAAGRPRQRFAATLPFSWPSDPQRRQPPLFPAGYGLRYAAAEAR